MTRGEKKMLEQARALALKLDGLDGGPSPAGNLVRNLVQMIEGLDVADADNYVQMAQVAAQRDHADRITEALFGMLYGRAHELLVAEELDLLDDLSMRSCHKPRRKPVVRRPNTQLEFGKPPRYEKCPRCGAAWRAGTLAAIRAMLDCHCDDDPVQITRDEFERITGQKEPDA